MSPEFASVIEKGRVLQRVLREQAGIEAVAVGGTGAALHARHRFSLDVDHVTDVLTEKFDTVIEVLDAVPGWQTNRQSRPVIILGSLDGIEQGIRQQRAVRRTPIEKTVVEGLTIPTAPEMLRIKAYLCADRRSVRDAVDAVALADHLGATATRDALLGLNACYAPLGAQSPLLAFAEACMAEPVDKSLIGLSDYKGIREPYDSWEYLGHRRRELAELAAEIDLGGGRP